MTLKTTLIPLAILALLPMESAQAEWEVTHPNLGTIAFGVDFTSADEGFIAGGNNGSGPIIWKTTNGGDDYGISTDETVTMMYLDVAMGSGDMGVAGGMGAFWLFGGGSHTTNAGRTWNRTGDPLFFAAYQDVDAVGESMGVMAGSWGSLRTYEEGVAITRDSGRSWDYYDWGIDTWPRYVDFISEDVGFVSGGHWPTESARLSGGEGMRVSQHVKLAMGGGMDPRAESIDAVDYRGVVAKTTTGGQSFEVILDVPGLYFNGLQFINEQEGWVVGEGENSASIFHTDDGGLTWDEQWTGDATLMSVRMIDSERGFAVGGDLSNRRPTGLILETSDGGQSWAPMALDADFILFNLDIIDENNAWAVGINLATNNCGVLRYRGQ